MSFFYATITFRRILISQSNMNMHTGAHACGAAAYGQGSGSILEEIHCQGTEPSVVNCSFIDYQDKYNRCFHDEDSGVSCGKLVALTTYIDSFGALHYPYDEFT